jgi:hypothetical protein
LFWALAGYLGSLITVSVAIGLPMVTESIGRDGGARCVLDGGELAAAYRMRMVDQRGHSHAFCCVRCGEIWLGRQHSSPTAIFVTDEITGRELDAAEAHFVRSQVVTHPMTGNRCHVFANKADAELHARTNRGRMLSGSERPFVSRRTNLRR